MESIITTGVFNRYSHDKLSANAFYGWLTISTVWGLVLTAVVAKWAIGIGFIPNWWQVILLGLALPLWGGYIAIKNDDWFISFVGYNMMVIPFGLVLGPVIHAEYKINIIQNAFEITAGITVIMGIMGTMKPSIFSEIGSALNFCLLGLIVFGVISIFVPALQRFKLIDYIGAAVFSLFIAYDMSRAYKVPKTVNNAIDLSVDLYLDIINLFLYVLSLGKDDD